MEKMVREFHVKYGHLITEKPTSHIPPEVKLLRKNIIKEEFEELMLAIDQDDLVGIADGISDLAYVIVGTAVSYGIPFDRVTQEVHRSNMTKTPIKASAGQKYGTETPKGPDFVPPHIWRILFEPELETELEKQ